MIVYIEKPNEINSNDINAVENKLNKKVVNIETSICNVQEKTYYAKITLK